MIITVKRANKIVKINLGSLNFGVYERKCYRLIKIWTIIYSWFVEGRKKKRTPLLGCV